MTSDLALLEASPARPMTVEEEKLAREFYAAVQNHTNESTRSLQSSAHRVGVSDLGFCLRGSTEVPTRQGILPIGELAGQAAELLVPQRTGSTIGGRATWRPVEVRQFGVQPLTRIVLSRTGGAVRDIYATAEHQWFVTRERRNRGYTLTRTSDLRVGDRMRSARAGSPQLTEMIPAAVVMGFIHGDGSMSHSDSEVTIYQRSNKTDSDIVALLRAFARTEKDTGQGNRYRGFPRSWKPIPDFSAETAAFALSWLAGYFAADGSVDQRGGCTIQSSNRTSIEAVRYAAVLAGVSTNPIRERMVTSGYGQIADENRTIYLISLRRRTVPGWFFLNAHHHARATAADQAAEQDGSWVVRSVEETGLVEPVYCAIVEENEAFVLTEDLVTHNCSERVRRHIAGETEPLVDHLPAFIGTALGDHVEAAVMTMFPTMIRQSEVVITLNGDGGIYNLTGHPDLIDPAGLLVDVKGLALDTPIPTPTGWTTMGALAVGDTVYDRDGQTCRVVDKSRVKHEDCFEVEFRNGHRVVCDSGHRWVVSVQGREEVWTVEQMLGHKAVGKAVSIPVAGSLMTPQVTLPIDPWCLGYWLGNGDAAGGRVTTHAEDRAGVAAAYREAGWQVSERTDPRTGAGTVHAHSGHTRDAVTGRMVEGDGLRKRLADLGLLGHKHVPGDYLRAGTQQRLALLRGLMDSDGSWNRARRRVTFTSTDQALTAAVAELARSLGERVCRSTVQRMGFGHTVTSYDAEWTPTLNPFALPRKADRVDFGKAKVHQHRVVSVRPVESVPTQCISVDSPSRTYLCGEAMIPTHNTSRGLGKVRRTGPSQQQQFQRHCYAKAAHEAGLFDVPLDQVKVANIWFDRSADEREPYVHMEPYDERVVTAATMWLDDVVYAYMHGEQARKEPPPAMCFAACGFAPECRAGDGSNGGLIEDPDQLAAIAMTLEARELEKRARQLKDEAKVALQGVQGSTGEFTIRWVKVGSSYVAYERPAYERLDIRPTPK